MSMTILLILFILAIYFVFFRNVRSKSVRKMLKNIGKNLFGFIIGAGASLAVLIYLVLPWFASAIGDQSVIGIIILSVLFVVFGGALAVLIGGIVGAALLGSKKPGKKQK